MINNALLLQLQRFFVRQPIFRVQYHHQVLRLLYEFDYCNVCETDAAHVPYKVIKLKHKSNYVSSKISINHTCKIFAFTRAYKDRVGFGFIKRKTVEENS